MAPQREWLDKDYYAVLGVSKDASAEDVKKAYRKLARANHPDSKPDDPAAEQRFKEIGEAYAVLGDDDKRREYDQIRKLAANGGGFGGGGFGGGWGNAGANRGANIGGAIGSAVGGFQGGAVGAGIGAAIGR